MPGEDKAWGETWQFNPPVHCYLIHLLSVLSSHPSSCYGHPATGTVTGSRESWGNVLFGLS